MAGKFAAARQAGMTDHMVGLGRGAKDAAQQDDIAEAAEKWALARYGLPPGRDHECDHWEEWRTKKGMFRRCLDVKSTISHSNRLIVPRYQMDKHLAKHGKPCSVYLLVTGRPGDFILQGWAWGFRVLAHPQTDMTDSPYGLRRDSPYFKTNTDLMMAATFGLTVVDD